MPKKATLQGAMPEEAMPVGGDDAQEGDALRVGRTPAIYSIASAGRRGFPGARRHGAVYRDDEIAHWQPSSWF